ncbi:MAG TPA: Hint domain-containing protein, partial [Acetobacteraceae bacterium]
YTSVVDTGFPFDTSLGTIFLSPNVTLDVQQTVTVSEVSGSRSTDGTGSDSGLLEVGNGAVVTYTSDTAGGDFHNQTLYVKSDGVGAAGEVVFTATTFGIDLGAVITMDGVNFDARAIVDPTALITLKNGATFNATADDAFNDGTIALSDGVANLSQIGDLSNGTGGAADQVVDMSGTGHDELVLPNTPDGMGLTITGYGVDDLIGVAGISSVKSASYDASQDLNFFSGTNGAGSLLAQLTGVTLDTGLPATLDPSQFSIVTNGAGTFVELIACFAEGTRIMTDEGPVAVEKLREGDRLEVLLGETTEPVIWIGHRRVDCQRHPRPEQVWPIRVSANAFGPGRPCRDLWLSPDHAIFFAGMLTPVKYLINGTSIVQVPRNAVTYYHVELPKHNLVLAEGLPAESYLNVGNRSDFWRQGQLMTLFPDFFSRIWEAEGCAPLVITGPAFEAARRWVNALAATKPVRPVEHLAAGPQRAANTVLGPIVLDGPRGERKLVA